MARMGRPARIGPARRELIAETARMAERDRQRSLQQQQRVRRRTPQRPAKGGEAADPETAENRPERWIPRTIARAGNVPPARDNEAGGSRA
jgi:hypothetical protein